MRLFSLLLGAILFIAGCAPAAVCPNGYSLTRGNDKCYKFTDATPATYDLAVQRCAEYSDGRLPVILDQEDNDALKHVWLEGREATGAISNYPWLGLRCKNDDECTLINGATYKFNLFDDSKPDTTLGACVSLRGPYGSENRTRWVSTECSEAKLVICESEQLSLCDPPYRSIDNHCMLYAPELRLNYFAADVYCREAGGMLAVIDDEDQNTALLSFIQERNKKYLSWNNVTVPPNVFLGAKLAANGHFEWSDKSRLGYSNFDKPYPSERYGHCLTMVAAGDKDSTTGFWQNYVCTAVLPFACAYRDATPTPAGQCPSRPYYSDSGRIQSPNFPIYYGDSLNCVHHVNVELSSFVEIRLDALNLVGGDDRLEFYDGEDSTQPFRTLTNASLAPLTFTTEKSNLVRIHFRTFNTETDGDTSAVVSKAPKIGWHLAFRPVGSRGALADDGIEQAAGDNSTNQSGACPPAVYTQSNGELTTLGFHDGINYANFIRCAYTLSAPANRIVELTFGAFRTEQCCDVLYVYDGAGEGAPFITKLSGIDPETPKLRSSGSAMRLLFVSDSQVNDRGFAALYSFVPANATAAASPSVTAARKNQADPHRHHKHHTV